MEREELKAQVGGGVEWGDRGKDSVMFMSSFRWYPVPKPCVCRLSSSLWGNSQVCSKLGKSTALIPRKRSPDAWSSEPHNQSAFPPRYILVSTF